MTVQNIFEKLAVHMIKGLMIHQQLSNYYDFLGLEGYQRCHEYHYFDQSQAHKNLCHYYINHYNKIIPQQRFEIPTIIPEFWYEHLRQDADTAFKKEAVKNGVQMWIDWEKETKIFYEQMFSQLMKINQVATALYLKDLLCDVTKELEMAERAEIRLKAINYDMTVITEQQKQLCKKYRKK